MENLSVWADALKTKQILLNLLSNAVKYNRSGGSISFNIHYYDNDKLRLSITDTGYGIDRKNMDKLFQPFNRLDAEKTTVEGTGIGLAISKTLIEKMGGSIGVISTKGQGSTFWIALEKFIAEKNSLELNKNTYACYR